MAASRMTHIGSVVNYNYGSPYRYSVDLRETLKYWITENGTKFRKADGNPAGADSWNQTKLQLTTIKPIP